MSKLFENILRESNKAELENGWKAYFQRGPQKDTFDLFLESPNKRRFGIKDAAWYTSGYDQGFGNISSKAQNYIKTIFGYGAGNGGGSSSKPVPRIHTIKYLRDKLVEITDGIEEGILTGESSAGEWEIEEI
jgi:hypothetical protein